jgi:dolichol-phosphate mannosyltransferase
MKSNKDISIVIPSYNEVQSLKVLLKNIGIELPGAKVIIVDDSYPEENLRLKKIVKGMKNLVLISRLKRMGRGTAILEGFREALKERGMNYVFEMDSDLAHDPKEFKRFLKIKNKRVGLIIGSRYLPGGRIINIAPNRTIMSRVINKFLYYWLGMHLSDHTSGFRLYSRSAAQFLVKTKIKARGFIALSETAYKLFLAGYVIMEVPITWNYRVYGKSNVNFKELFNSFIAVILMKFNYL